MVMSNKKLKQTLRAAKAELLAAAESHDHSDRADSEMSDSKSLAQQSLEALLNLAASKPRLSKREKRRRGALQEGKEIESKGQQSGDERKENEESKTEGPDEQSEKKEKKKNNKRKRGDVEIGESQNAEVESAKKSEKKKKKQNRKKNTKEKKTNTVVKKDEENFNAESGETSAPETINLNNSQGNAYDSRKVYVGGIPYYSTEDDIRSYFESCGTITEVDCMTFPESGKFRGIAIISFKTEEGAKRALSFDGADMGGFFLKIQPYKYNRANKIPDFCPTIIEGYNRIYVGNLSWDITVEELQKFFSNCNISSIRFGEDKETGEFRGYAHVDFMDNLSLMTALKLDQIVICGRPVKISCAVPKKGADTNSSSVQTNKPVDEEKMKRTTCYECDKKGHIATSCPKKQPVVSVASENPETGAVSGKIRRRTCYDCGKKGHLSSSCPKKLAPDSVTSGAT